MEMNEDETPSTSLGEGEGTRFCLFSSHLLAQPQYFLHLSLQDGNQGRAGEGNARLSPLRLPRRQAGGALGRQAGGRISRESVQDKLSHSQEAARSQRVKQ